MKPVSAPSGYSVKELPLVPFLPEIRKGLGEKGVAVVRSETGSGKSTLLPLSLLESAKGKIILLEPRRAAAMGIASRMAELLGEKIGERVGYSVRLERKISASTRIEVLTEGLFIRRVQAAPSMDGIDTVIFDEFHERSAVADLALAFLLDLRRMGAAVKLLIMSATINAGKVADFINRSENRSGDSLVPVFDVPGRVFPVETSYRPLPGKQALGIETGAALKSILGETAFTPAAGDTLVFLPGRREISDAENILNSWDKAGDFDILPLHGSLPLSRQREITGNRKAGGSGKRRIILSTNIAESALTIPGVDMVVDTGFVRLERFHIPTAMNRLSLEEAGGMSAEQRKGRAGRLGPGRCVRLWNPSAPRPAAEDPEINRIDLSGLVLECLLWGVRSREDLAWLDPPPASAWERAVELLRELGAVDDSLKPTEHGREGARLGLEPRLGILCLAGKSAGCPELACAAAAALAERDGSTINGDGDFRRRLSLLRNDSAQKNPWIKTVRETAADLIGRLSGNRSTALRSWNLEEEANVGELLAAAFPDRLALRQSFDQGSGAESKFRFYSGREARIEGPLRNEEWLVAAEVDAGERSAFIRLAAPVSKETALEILGKRAVTETFLEWRGLSPRTVMRHRAGKIFLGEEKRPGTLEEAVLDLPRLLREQGLSLLPWEEGNGAPKRLIERIRFYAANSGNEVSVKFWSDEVLISDVPGWLIPFAGEPKNQPDGVILNYSALVNALKNRLGWDLSIALDRDVPGEFNLPSGRKRAIDYSSGFPVLQARIQDCFGMNAHPRIMDIPVVFHLLSPANRPIQITSDLPGFWAGSYADVRKDMKGRYPKHFWPVL